MQAVERHHGNPRLRAIVIEASRALALLDTQRLEELALSCQALNRTLAAGGGDLESRKSLVWQSKEAAADLTVFGRVLEATRANVNVMNRLREMRGERLEYRVRSAAAECVQAESGHGNH